jgi:hypothetical protein
MIDSENILREMYYLIKPFLPRRTQLYLRRKVALRKRASHSTVWPIDERAKRLPEGWSGWPDGRRFALLVTHDVESQKGQDRCEMLAGLDESHGLRSSFNFIAKAYDVSPELKHSLLQKGFEVGVHGLYHDGNLFRSRKKFRNQASEINYYLQKWGSVGFRTPCMYHNLEWISDLHIDYDSSTFDTDPFEPQPDGVGTIFPFWVRNSSASRGYVELPYTLPQDFTLFILMKERSIDIWKKKLDWIVENGGMALSITHPDYMNWKNDKCETDEYPIEFYEEFLDYIKSKYAGHYWNPLPREMARFWKAKIEKRDSTLVTA